MKCNHKLADKFLKDINTSINIEYERHGKHFLDDKETRDIYKVTLKKGSRKYTFMFGNSLLNSGYKYKGRILFKKDGEPAHDLICAKAIQKEKYGYVNTKNITRPIKPTPYDVLSCLTKYDPESFEYFCNSYGYDDDSIKVKKIYDAVVNEYKNLCTLYNEEEMDMLREIN